MNHSQLEIKRQLKRSKLFEIRKIIKQIRMLKNKKGTDVQLQKNQRKVERLVEVLDAIKDLNLTSLAEEVYKSLQKGSSILPYSLQTEEQGSAISSCTERARYRLLTNKTFKRSLTSIETRKEDSIGKQQTSLERQHAVVVESEGSSSSDGEENDQLMNSISDTESGSDSDNIDSTALSETQDTVDSERDSDSEDSSHKLEKRLIDEVTDHLGKESTRQRKRLTTRNSGLACDQEDVPLTRNKPLSLESMFVGTLSTDSHHSNLLIETRKEDLHSKKRAKHKLNRPGQRTRQKQWEKQFGVKAKHMLKKDSGESNRNRVKGNKKFIRRNQTEVISSRHTSTGDSQLHPSWEAQRKKKTKEAGIPQFQGQRIVFPD